MKPRSRSAVTLAPGHLEIREGEIPMPRPGEALVRVELVGLCGSDYHIYDGSHPYAVFPQVQGHELVGLVAALPDGYAGPCRVGDRVVVEPLRGCGACFACERGRPNCCADVTVMGVQVPGGLAEHVAVPVEQLVPVGGLPAALAVLTEPVAIGLHAVNRARIGETNGMTGGMTGGTAGGAVVGTASGTSGGAVVGTADGAVVGTAGGTPGGAVVGAAGGLVDDVVVIGAGPIGLAAALAAVDRGARVLVADRIGSRLAIAARAGVAAVVDTSEEDLAGAVDAFTGGRGAAVVIEATGVPALVRLAVDVVAHSGTVVVVGISTADVPLRVSDFSRKEINLLGSRNSAGEFAAAVDLVRRRADALAGWVTHTFGLDEVAKAIEFAQANPHEVEKVVISCVLD